MVRRLLVALPLAALGALWFWFLILPWPILLRWRDPGTTAFMEQRLAEARAESDSLILRHEWVPLERISSNLRRAVIIAEDGRFREHRGIDWHALAEELRYSGDDDFSLLDPDDLGAAWSALRYYLRNRDEVRGRSTITQQLAKNLYFSADRSALRKLKEVVVARRLEWFLDKDRILEVYLNVAEWGPGIFGAEAASRRYFGTSADQLSLYQAASLAATLPHPLTSNPDLRPGRMGWRRDRILAQLQGAGPPRTVPLEPELPEIEAPEPEPLEPDAPDLLPPDTAPPPQDTTRADSAPPPPTDSAPPPGDTTPPPPQDTAPPPHDSEPPPAPAALRR